MKADWKEFVSFFEMDTDAVLAVEEGRISFANGAARELLGECEGEECARLIPVCAPEKDGECFTTTALLNGRTVMVSGMKHRDVTLLRIRPEERRTPIAVGTLNALRNAAIEIQFPVERLLSRLNEAENDLYGAALRHGSYELRRLVQNLGDLNDLAEGTLVLGREIFELGSFCATLADSVRTFMPRMSPTLRAECDGGCFICGDRRRMDQIVLNLLANAYRHTPPEGSIELRVMRRGEKVLLSVRDDGEGITPAEMETLFALPRNELSRANGAGLGLRLVRELVELHDGKLTAESGKEKGSVFTVELPLSRVLPLRDAGEYESGSAAILTELAPVLDHRAYRSRFTD